MSLILFTLTSETAALVQKFIGKVDFMAKKENPPLEEILQAADIKESQDPAQIWVDKLRVELVKLGLKIIEDIDNRRVAKPEETYNSLVTLYNSVK